MRDIEEGSPEGNKMESLCSALTGRGMGGDQTAPLGPLAPGRPDKFPWAGSWLGGR